MSASPFAATQAEFKYRVWFFAAMFFLAYSCYWIDNVNAGQAIAAWFARHFNRLGDTAWVRLVFFKGAALVFIAAAIRTWGTSYLHTSVMNDSKLHTERLLADGPFRYVRNPLYFGNIILAFGMGTTTSRVGFFVLVVLMFIFSYRLILREEAELSATQGESYRAYCATVPRLLPSLTPRVPSAGNSPNWVDGFLGELMFWGFGIAVVVLAVTLNGTAFQIAFFSSFVLPWLPLLFGRKESHS